jgi:hypothetical protein
MVMSASGGLAEAFDALGGTVRMDPSREGILDAVRGLTEPDAWNRALDGLRTLSPEDGNREWVAAHAAIYRAALGAAQAPERPRAPAAR